LNTKYIMNTAGIRWNFIEQTTCSLCFWLLVIFDFDFSLNDSFDWCQRTWFRRWIYFFFVRFLSEHYWQM